MGSIQSQKILKLNILKLNNGLESNDAILCYNAARVLKEFNDSHAMDILLNTLKDQNDERRAIAANTIGRLGNLKAVEPLIQILKNDPFNEARQWAAQSLGWLKSVEAVESLIKALWADKDNKVRGEAAHALGEIQDRKVIKPLIELLENHDEDISVQYNIVCTLGLFRDKQATEPLLILLETDKNEDNFLKFGIFSALVHIRDEKAIGPLVKLLHNEDEEIREESAYALGQMGNGQAIEPLLNILRDITNNDCIRGIAAEALGKLGSMEALYFINEFLEQDKGARDDTQRQKAALALINLGAAGIIKLIDVLKASSNPYAISSAIEALAIIGETRAIDPILSFLNSNEDHIRRASATALGFYNDEAVVNPLTVALQDKDLWVRINALGSLARLKKFEPIRTLVDENKADEKTREVALYLLDRSERT